MKRLMMLMLALLAATVMALAGCGGGGGGSSSSAPNTDRDGDGIPNVEDAFPDDATRFSDYATVLLNRLAGGQFGTAVAVNDNDLVVGLSDDTTGVIKAAKWTVSGTTTPLDAVALPSLEPEGYSAAYGVDAAGTAAGESEKAGNFVAVIWPDGAAAPTELSLAGVNAPAAAYGISGSRIVGEAFDGSGPVAVLWGDAAAAPVTLAGLGGTGSHAYAIRDTMIVGESATAGGEVRGVVWFIDAAGAAGAPVPLEPLAGHTASIALGINTGGEVVGESESAAGEVHAVLWRLNADGTAGDPVDMGIGSGSAINDSRIAGSSGTPNQAVVWDTRNTSLAQAILTGSFSFSQAYGMNDGHLVVGLAGTQGFVALPVAQ